MEFTGEIMMGINPLLIGLGLQGGLSLLSGRSAEKKRKKQQAQQDRRDAFSTLVASLGGAGGRPSPQQPQGATGIGAVAGDPLVQKLLSDLLASLLGGGGGGEGSPGGVGGQAMSLLGRLPGNPTQQPTRGLRLGAGGARRR